MGIFPKLGGGGGVYQNPLDYVTVNASYRAFWKTVMSTVGRDYAPRELHMDMETASSAAYMEVKKIYFLQKITSGI